MSPAPDLSRAVWVKSSYSGNGGADCLEWAPTHAAATRNVPVRDSKTPHGPVLIFESGAWSAFVSAAKGDTFGG